LAPARLLASVQVRYREVATCGRRQPSGPLRGAARADWDECLSALHVEIPDPVVNPMPNLWNPVQCRATLYWSRFVSGYETGLGRGMGTRDSGQDTLGTVHSAPEQARRTLIRIWQLQFADGRTWHQFFPLTSEGGLGLAAEHPEWPQWFSDDHLGLRVPA
jgi:cellobiose phosphorylase